MNICKEIDPTTGSYCAGMISLFDMAKSWADDLEDMGQGQKSWKGSVLWKENYSVDMISLSHFFLS